MAPAEDGPASASPAPPDTLRSWLNALALAESGNRQWLVHRDRDGQLYYGCLQFQERTFRAYVRKFHLLPRRTRSETMERIYDCAFQKRLAALMIRDDPNNWKHWKGTVEKRVGLPPSNSVPGTARAASEPQPCAGYDSGLASGTAATGTASPTGCPATSGR